MLRVAHTPPSRKSLLVCSKPPFWSYRRISKQNDYHHSFPIMRLAAAGHCAGKVALHQRRREKPAASKDQPVKDCLHAGCRGYLQGHLTVREPAKCAEHSHLAQYVMQLLVNGEPLSEFFYNLIQMLLDHVSELLKLQVY